MNEIISWFVDSANSMPSRTLDAFQHNLISFVGLAQLVKVAAIFEFALRAARSTLRSVAVATPVFIAILIAIDPFSYSEYGALFFYLVLAVVLLVIGSQNSLVPREKRFEDFASEKQARCTALSEAVVDNGKVIDNYRAFLDGRQTWEQMMSHLKTIGNAYTGVTSEGKRLHPAVQEAIAEVEAFDFGEEGVQSTKLFWLALTDTEEAFWEEKARIEIERQTHFNQVLERRLSEGGCRS